MPEAFCIAAGLFLTTAAAIISQNAAVTALISVSGIASSLLMLNMKSIGTLTPIPALCWLAFTFGGFLPGILTAAASITAGLCFYRKSAPARSLFLSFIPVSILFSATVPAVSSANLNSLLLIPAGMLVQVVFLIIIRSYSKSYLLISGTGWLTNGLFAFTIRFFLNDEGFYGGALALGVMLISLMYARHTGSSLQKHSGQISTLSLQNRLVSFLYSDDDTFPLFLCDGFHVWTLQGKPADMKVPVAPEQPCIIETRGDWHVVSTQNSVFIAGGEAAAELKSLGAVDLRETLQLLETVWRASFSKRRLENAFIGAAGMFVHLADRKDSDTHHHSLRVSQTAVALGRILGLPEAELFQLKVGALLHDIGKLAVPARLIMKKGLLTESERSVINTHPRAGAKLLLPMQRYRQASLIVLQHHERIDGSGYPDGLKGSAISLHARIVSVADAYDAITSHRAYHYGKPSHIALREIRKYSGIRFDNTVVDALEEMLL
jgi:putative nucleotidyltransferase with HDIG domain